MPAKLFDITAEQGADYTTPFPPIVDASGNPVDITNDSFAMQVRTVPGDPTALLTLTSDSGAGLTNGGTSGVVTPFIDFGIMAAILPGRYVYDLKRRTANGLRSFPYSGSFIVPGEVTTIDPPTPSTAPALLNDDGTYILNDDGGKILL